MPVVDGIQRSIYPPSLHEASSLILERACIFPQGSLVALNLDKTVVGYCSSYPYPAEEALARPPSLGTLDSYNLSRALSEPTKACLFIHEVSIYAQGMGIGKAMIRHLLSLAVSKKYSTVVLVSVLGNRAYYESFGFQVVRVLSSYSAEAAQGSSAAPPQPPLPPTASYFSEEKEAHVMQLFLSPATLSASGR